MAGLPVQQADFNSEDPMLSLSYVRSMLKRDDPDTVLEVYGKFARQVWSMCVERRMDDGLRDWHHVLQSIRAYVRGFDPVKAERFVVLSDFVSESINAAESSPAKHVAQRPQAKRILTILRDAEDFVRRQDLLTATRLKSSNLTNILTNLSLHGLVERRDEGKEASFKITRRGAEALGVPLHQPGLGKSLHEFILMRLRENAAVDKTAEKLGNIEKFRPLIRPVDASPDQVASGAATSGVIIPIEFSNVYGNRPRDNASPYRRYSFGRQRANSGPVAQHYE